LKEMINFYRTTKHVARTKASREYEVRLGRGVVNASLKFHKT